MRSVTVGLLWHSLDSGNLGVRALTYSQMYLVKAAALEAGVTVEFVLIGWVQDSAARSVPDVVLACQVNTKRLIGIQPDLIRALARCDAVLDIGEGDSFSDIYGWKRLIFLLGTKWLAAHGKRPLILSPQTLGPFHSRFAAALADIAMSRARAVCARDELSVDYYRSRCLTTPLHETVDVAFALPFERQAKPVDASVQVGINVSGLLWSGGYTKSNQFGLQLDYQKTILEIVGSLVSQRGIEVVLVPHVVTPNRIEEDDLRACEQVRKQYSGLEIAGPFESPMAAKSMISSLNFFVGARMHACIAAFSAGVPSVPMAYSRKFTGLFGSLGYEHVADCTKDNQHVVVAKVRHGFSARQALAEDVAKGNAIAQQKLRSYTALLVEMLRGLAHA